MGTKINTKKKLLFLAILLCIDIVLLLLPNSDEKLYANFITATAITTLYLTYMFVLSPEFFSRLEKKS